MVIVRIAPSFGRQDALRDVVPKLARLGATTELLVTKRSLFTSGPSRNGQLPSQRLDVGATNFAAAFATGV
jgi:hypothetical protein